MRPRLAISIYGLLGAAAIAGGLYLWWPPGALIFIGGFIIADAWQLSERLPGGDDRQ